MNRQKLILIVGLGVIALAVLGGTSAYFVTAERTHNIVSTDGVAVEIVETSVDAGGNEVPFENITNALPGETYSKIPRVKNIDNGEIWVRAKVDVSAEASDGSILPVPDGALVIDYNVMDWTLKDNYYYYKAALATGNMTEALFTQVAITNDLPDEYQSAKFKVVVLVEAVQTAHNGTSALDAEGWSEG